MNQLQAPTSMLIRSISLTSLLLYSSNSFSQAHVHGQGQALIAQQGNEWEINIILPAADVLGFEHAPETEEQKKIVRDFKRSVSSELSTVVLDKSCKRTSFEIKAPEGPENHDDEHDHHKGSHNDKHSDHGHHDKDHHDENHHDHDKEHHDDKHHDHEEEHHDDKHHEHEEEHHEDVHSNVEIKAAFSCGSSVSSISFPVIEKFPSLDSIEVQWFTDNGQGAGKVTKTSTSITL